MITSVDKSLNKKVISWHTDIQNKCPYVKWEQVADTVPKAVESLCKLNDCKCNYKNCTKVIK